MIIRKLFQFLELFIIAFLWVVLMLGLFGPGAWSAGTPSVGTLLSGTISKMNEENIL